ncbi:MAG: hypothetical protein H6734_08885 [Alphaproteobacteria bacterium]|nr:hypothetical protein [Alphaproteobacteria bacterium]
MTAEPASHTLPRWDGTDTHAADLRTRAATLSVPRGRPADGERGLRKLLAAYGGQPDTGRLLRWLAERPSELPATAALLGDPALGPWPWDAPLTVGDDDALAALGCLAEVRIPGSPEVARFLRVFFRDRRRGVWTTASRALARQSPHTAAQLWTRTFPAGLDLAPTDRPHRLVRHVAHLGFALAALGEAPPGFAPAEPLAAPPHDDADWSVLIAGAALCLDHPDVVPALVRGTARLGAHPLAERALLDVLPLLPHDVRPVVEGRLREERWVDTDGLLAHRDTLRALGVPTPSAHLPIREVATRLRDLFDPVLGDLASPRERATELVALLETLREHHPDRPWSPLARAAGLQDPKGAVGEVAADAIGLQTALSGWPVQHLLRSARLDEGGWLALASRQEAVVATQVALHVERTLREVNADPERVRVLWRLLQADPPARTFEELLALLRADVLPGSVGEGPVFDLVRAVAGLDAVRDGGGSLAELAVALEALDHAAVPLLDGGVRPPFVELAALVRDDGGASGIVEGLTGLLAPGMGGLLAWNAWIDGRTTPSPEETSAAGRATRELVRALDELAAAHPQVLPHHVTGLVSAADLVRRLPTRFGWPERFAVLRLLARLETEGWDALDRGTTAVGAARALERALVKGDEQAVLACVATPEARAALRPQDLTRVQAFLLDGMRWADAARLRAQVADRVDLRAPAVHLLPIFAAVAGGSLLVLDFGDAWLQMAAGGLGPRYALTVVLTLGMSFLVLATTIGGRSRCGSRVLVVRTAPVFLATWLTAAVSSGLVAITLGSVSLITLPLFASLALFLGVFVGLILQGRSLRADP